MSPEERALTPEQEARVSHLLADARADAPMPDAVAERLDGVLAGLGPEQDEKDDEALVALAARRRRRVGTLLAAAAAVVVAGVAVGQLFDPGLDTSAEDASTSLEQPPDRATAADADQGEAGAVQDSLPREQVPTPYSSRQLPDALKAFGDPKSVSGRSFAADARRLQRHPGVRSVPGLMDGADLTAPGRDFMCAEADFGPGKLMAVRYDGSPAVLAFREPHGATQVVDLLQCGSGEIIRSTTLSID